MKGWPSRNWVTVGIKQSSKRAPLHCSNCAYTENCLGALLYDEAFDPHGKQRSDHCVCILTAVMLSP
jgi:hypothetical protein